MWRRSRGTSKCHGLEPRIRERGRGRGDGYVVDSAGGAAVLVLVPVPGLVGLLGLMPVTVTVTVRCEVP